MKKLLLATMCCIAALIAQAQVNPTTTAKSTSNTDVTQQDYERMLKNAKKVAFRTYVIETLGLTEDEIKKFDPVYMSYMTEKNKLMQKRQELLEDYTEEIKEDDSVKNEEEDKADYLEDYWEIEIEEAKLEKDYFDKLEDKISVDDAFSFFILEDIAENDIIRHYIERRFVPFIIEFEDSSTGSTNKAMPGTTTTPNNNLNSTTKNNMGSNSTMNNTTTTDQNKSVAKQTSVTPGTTSNMKYKKDIDAFGTWMKGDRGKVALDHQFTHNGLMALMSAVTALYEANGVKDASFTTKRQQVMEKADKLTEDPKSTQHADWAREAFILSAEMLEMVQQKTNATAASTAITQVKDAAHKIDPDKLMTPQATHIYNFFDKAHAAVNALSNNVAWSNN